MTKEVIYVYLGTNGTIQSPVHLEDVYYIRKCRLWADRDKVLTKDNKIVVVHDNNINNKKIVIEATDEDFETTVENLKKSKLILKI